MSSFYIGDTPLIKLDCVNDISGATSPKIHYKKPDGTIGSWTATVVSDRYLQYQITTGQLDQAGKWLFQAGLTVGSWSGYGETAAVVILQLFQ